jgi:hypothetical protein
MTIDRMTKVLLALIAVALLLNALNPWLLPIQSAKAVQADDTNRVLRSIEGSVKNIANGTCTNSKI